MKCTYMCSTVRTIVRLHFIVMLKIPSFVTICIALVVIISNRHLLHTCLKLKDSFTVLSSKYGDHKIRYQFQGQGVGKVKTSQQNQFFPYFASIDSLLKVSRGGGKKTIKPAVICIHGFGGNADQFRKNLPVLSANGYDTYAIDLLGYGYR